MSKAFTRESDAPEPPFRPRPVSVLPPGTKNYLTASGAESVRHELERLLNAERPRLAADGSDEAKEKVRGLDERIAYLQHTLHTATIVPSPEQPDDTVRFGATVTVRDHSGAETSYRIVGVDETDLDRDWVSWLSPIAKALLNARVGQRVKFKFPSGEGELEILRVGYGG